MLAPPSSNQQLPTPEDVHIPNLDTDEDGDGHVVTRIVKAYGICCEEERRLLAVQSHQPKPKPKQEQEQEGGAATRRARLFEVIRLDFDLDLICIRILGYMFVHNSGRSMLMELASCVIEAATTTTTTTTACAGSCDERTRLIDLGRFFLNYWIRPSEFSSSLCNAHSPYYIHT